MSSPEEIHADLTRIANDALPLAVFWHASTVAALVALALGWRPSKRAAGALLVTPLVSVGVLAFVHHNPFNAAMFATLATALLVLAPCVSACTSTLDSSWELWRSWFVRWQGSKARQALGRVA